mgnify:CR=1 FL=1
MLGVRRFCDRASATGKMSGHTRSRSADGPAKKTHHHRHKSVAAERQDMILKLEADVRKLKAQHQKKRDYLQSLEDESKELDAKVLAQKRRMGEYAALFADEKTAKFQRMGAALAAKTNEEKLNHAFETLKKRNMIADQQLNEVKAHNADLRYKIDNMRREKIIFERAFADLEKDLAQQKLLVDRNNAAIEADRKAKEMADQQMATTKREFLKRQEQMRQEMKELEQKAKINAEKHLDFEIDEVLPGGKKGRGRSKGKGRGKAASGSDKGKAKAKGSPSGGGGQMKKRLQKTILKKFGNEEDTKKMKNFGYYADMWKNIREKTGIEDIDELVMVFLQLEQRKMTRVKEANQLVSQIRALKVAEKEMKEERASYLKQNEDKLAKRKAFVRSLEKDVAKCKDSIAQAEAKTQEHLSVIRSLAGPVRTLYEKLNSEDLTLVLGKFLPTPLLMAGGKAAGVMLEDAADDDDVNPTQVLNMMGLIEQRITECAQFYQAHVASVRAATNSKDNKKLKNAFVRGPNVPSGKLKEQFETSLHKIMSITANRPTRDIDPSEKPLSYDELKAQALAELKGIKT